MFKGQGANVLRCECFTWCYNLVFAQFWAVCGISQLTDSFKPPWTARRSNQSFLKAISPESSLEGLMLKLKLQYFGHLMWRADSLEKTLMLGKIKGRRRRGRQRMRWLDSITDMSLGKFQELVMPSSHLILCRPLLLLPLIFPSIWVFSNESALRIRWPKYWRFSFSISPFSEHSGLISFRMDCLDLLAVQGTLKSLLQHHSSKASILRCSALFIVQLSHPYMTTGITIALTRPTFVGKVMSLLLNMLSRLVITFLPRNIRLFNFWLQSPSAVILEVKCDPKIPKSHELILYACGRGESRGWQASVSVPDKWFLSWVHAPQLGFNP